MNRTNHQPLGQKTLVGANVQVCAVGDAKAVTADSPALEVMTDLRKIPAASVSPSMRIHDVHQAMILRGVRLLFVADGDQVLGVVTSADLLGERPMTVARGRGIRVDELMAEQVMTPLSSVEAVSFDEMNHAEVGHVVATLQRSGRQHALVVEDLADGIVIRGIFSASQIARQMGVPMIQTEIARTFAEIEAAIAS